MRGAKRSNTRTYAQALRLLSYNYSESIDANVEIETKFMVRDPDSQIAHEKKLEANRKRQER